MCARMVSCCACCSDWIDANEDEPAVGNSGGGGGALSGDDPKRPFALPDRDGDAWAEADADGTAEEGSIGGVAVVGAA